MTASELCDGLERPSWARHIAFGTSPAASVANPDSLSRLAQILCWGSEKHAAGESNDVAELASRLRP